MQRKNKMRIYKWNLLLLEACRSLHCIRLHDEGICGIIQQIEQKFTGQKVLPWRDNAKDIKEQAWKIIENWDIRMAAKLFEIFPNIISKKYHNKPFVAEYDDKGNWVIIFN